MSPGSEIFGRERISELLLGVGAIGWMAAEYFAPASSVMAEVGHLVLVPFVAVSGHLFAQEKVEEQKEDGFVPDSMSEVKAYLAAYGIYVVATTATIVFGFWGLQQILEVAL